jgi:hypothetical protein
MYHCGASLPIQRKTNDWGWSAFLCNAKPLIEALVDPAYPEDALRYQEQGTAEFRIFGHEDGGIDVEPWGWGVSAT